MWTEEELDRIAADLVDETIIAAGGDLKRAARALRRTPYLKVPRQGPCTCADGTVCVNHCGNGPCSRRCQVCQRLAGMPSVPCPACPDAD